MNVLEELTRALAIGALARVQVIGAVTDRADRVRKEVLADTVRSAAKVSLSAPTKITIIFNEEKKLGNERKENLSQGRK